MERLLNLKEQMGIINAQIKEIAYSLINIYSEFKSTTTAPPSELESQMTKVASYKFTAELLEKERVALSDELLSAINNKQLEIVERFERLDTARQVAKEKFNVDGNRAELNATLSSLQEERVKNRHDAMEFNIFLKQLARDENDARTL